MAEIPTSAPVNDSYAEIFRELTASAKQLIQSEVDLIKTEVKELSAQTTNHLTQAIVFGALVIVSSVPLLAAAVIALGQYWDGNYALSALVVGVACAVVGGLLCFRAIKNLMSVDMMPASADSLKEGAEAVHRKSVQLTEAVAGV